jgi:arylsulfatase A-like enzyme
LYDSNVAFMDEQVGRFLDRLKELGLYDQSLIVFTADHGEDFMDKELFDWWIGHARKLFEEYIHVPLMIKLPGQTEGRTIEGSVQLLELLPTLVETAGLIVPPGYRHSGQGLDLGEGAEAPDRPIISETKSATSQQSVTWRGFKLIHDTRREVKLLYDLVKDPKEAHDQYDQDEEARQALEAVLTRWNEEIGSSVAAVKPETGVLKEDEVQRLKDLGYM